MAKFTSAKAALSLTPSELEGGEFYENYGQLYYCNGIDLTNLTTRETRNRYSPEWPISGYRPAQGIFDKDYISWGLGSATPVAPAPRLYVSELKPGTFYENAGELFYMGTSVLVNLSMQGSTGSPVMAGALFPNHGYRLATGTFTVENGG